MDAQVRFGALMVLLGCALPACGKGTVAGDYSGAFGGTIMAPAADGGIRILPASAASTVSLAGDAAKTTIGFEATFQLNADYSSGRPVGGGPTKIACKLDATRVGEPSEKGDVELKIAEQPCSDPAGLTVEGQATVKPGEGGETSVDLHVAATSHWGGPGQPPISFTLTFEGKKKKN